jgi:hypothetical protein
MSSMRFNARLDMSHHGTPHLFRDGGVVADSLTIIHNAMCPFVVNRSCIHKGHNEFRVSPRVKIQRIQTWRARRPCSGSSSAYLSVMIHVTENMSYSTKSDECGGRAVGPPLPIYRSWYMLVRTCRTARLKCAGAPTCMYHIRALPVVHSPVALADSVRGNLGSGCL